MGPFSEHEFEAKIDVALERIRTVLDNTRNPQRPEDVPHRYDDKFALAEFVACMSVASLLQCLEVVGLSADGLRELREWAKTRSVTLRLAAREDCAYVREESREVESAKHVAEADGPFGKSKRTDKVVTTIVEHVWRFEFSYDVFAYPGNAPERGIALVSRKGRVEIKTAAKRTPRPASVVHAPLDVNVTWLLGRVDAEGRTAFVIDRAAPSCHTPRRNDEIDEAMRELEALHAWCSRAATYFLHQLFPAQQEHGLDLSAIHARDVFVPVVPLFEKRASDAEGVLPLSFANAFLGEERRSLDEKCRALGAMFPRDRSVITGVEAALLATLLHAKDVCEYFALGVDHVEAMLRDQLVAAIGKVITPVEFDAFMRFHHRKLVKPEFWPKPFSYAIRRPEHSPEGVLGIESGPWGETHEPISTTVVHERARRPMSFALDASTRVSFLGDRYLHAWISHQFSGEEGLAVELVARARQFSSFILLVGRIASADSFEPRYGVILQNKDRLKIPLMLEQIPTPKEFRDAIESLSPEQQRFAKAFRGMQLESSLFGVCVIQIKPQLEALLKLPADSLTKEIKLTQDLLSLFIEYQIPSDLLSCDGPAEATGEEKLARVRHHVAKMHEMLDASKRREIEEEREREAKRLAENNRTWHAPGFAPQAGFGPPPAAYGRADLAPPTPVMRSAEAMPGPAFAMAPPAPMLMDAPAPRGAATHEAAAPTKPPPTATPTPTPTPTPRRGGSPEGGDVVDYTKLPAELDAKFEALDDDDALRATILNPGDEWELTFQKGLLSAPAERTLEADDQELEKSRAFDLLDALSKSGALPIEDASLHVVLAATHCFDRTLLDTVIQDNVNPIEKVERSLVIIGTTIHRRSAHELLADEQRDRFFETSPKLGE